MLIVADADAHIAVLISALQTGGYAPTYEMVNRLETLRDLLARAAWDVVLVAYPLGQITGFDAVAAVRARRADLPCIIFSEDRRAETIIAAMKAGARNYIVTEPIGSPATDAAVAERYPRLVAAIQQELRIASARRARHAAVAETRQRASTAETLVRLAARFNAQLELKAIIQAIGEEAAQAFQTPLAGVMLYDANGEVLRTVGYHGWPAQRRERIAVMTRANYDDYVRRYGNVAAIRDVRTETGLPDPALYAELDVRTLVTASLLREQELVGLVFLLTFEQARDFTPSELELLKGLADLAAQAISHARLFAQAERRLSHMRALHTIDLAISSSLDMRLTLNVLLEQALTQLQVTAADVLLLDHQTQWLSFAAGRGFKSTAPYQTTLRLGQGLAGRAALSRTSLHIPNLLQLTNDFLRLRWLKEEGFITQYVMPLIAKGQVKGVLEIFNRAPIALDEDWLNLIESLAGHAAIAIDNAELFESVQRSNQELAVAYEATIEGWSRALDLRDHETEGHSQRVSDMTLQLARALGSSTDTLIHMRRGALLHDIGKMGVSDSILLKPGPLDPNETTLMRRHPELAYSMLSPINYLRPALDIPYCHHEHWDGRGYPRGLRGDDIPLAARIFSVVDVYDALRSERPYRNAWTEGRVRQYLEQSAGAHFEPRVVEIFLRMQR